MFKFVLISALLVAAVCAAPADNSKPGQQGRTDGLDQAESAWNNNPNAWNAGQNTWGRDQAAWNHPSSWNHGSAWNHPNAWNRGYNNRNDMAAGRRAGLLQDCGPMLKWCVSLSTNLSLLKDTIPPTVGVPVLTSGTAMEPLALAITAGLDVVPPLDGPPVPLETAGTHGKAA